MSYDWLSKKMADADVKDADVHIPTGGDFVRGYAGEWTQRAMWKLYTTSDIDMKELGIPYDAKIPTRSGGGFFWYWRQAGGGYDNAIAACKAVDWRSPNNVWRWEMPSSTMLNWSGSEDIADTFGDNISVDVSIVGLMSTKRAEFHLLFLPSLVQSLALVSGILDEQIYNYDNLIFDAESVTTEYCRRMVGEAEGKDTKYEDGELWDIRTQIWLAMGEENPKTYTVGKDPKTDTASDKLAMPLSLLKTPGIGFWARMSRVAALSMPSDRDKENDRYPFGMNVMSQVWMTKEDAMKDLDVDSEVGGHPDLPEEWLGTPIGDFRAWVVKYIADNYDGDSKEAVVKAVKKNKALESSLSIKPEELVPWIEYVWK